MNTTTDIRVAKIIETDKIVINKGLFDHIDKNMEFIVYDEGDEIIDPITKESLGILENPKGTFNPIHIQEKMSILLAQVKRPNKLLSFMAFTGDEDIEYELLKRIKIGDKVKIINKIE